MDTKEKLQEELQDTTDNKVSNYRRIENTPFGIAKAHDGYVVLLGKHCVSKGFETEEEAEKDANTVTWDKIININVIISNKDDN